jgi:hypothetical protein
MGFLLVAFSWMSREIPHWAGKEPAQSSGRRSEEITSSTR